MGSNTIPKKQREEMDLDPFYHRCARRDALGDHDCERNPITRRLIEWHHAAKFAGKKVQIRNFIVPICWWSHEGPGKNDEIGMWIALNRATDGEILALSQAGGRDYFQYRYFLNKKYGVYNPGENTGKNTGNSTGINYGFPVDNDEVFHS